MWGALGVALNIGIARFTYGVMLPSLRRDLGIDYVTGGGLNAVHLAGYLVGTLASPAMGRRLGMAKLSAMAHLVIAAGAVLCAVAPSHAAAGVPVLGLGRLLTGLGAGPGVVAILVIAFAAVSASRRPLVSAVTWSGMGVAVVASGIAASFLLETTIGWRAAFAVSGLLALAIAAGFPPRHTAGEATASLGGAAPSRFPARGLLAPRWLFLTWAYLQFGIGYIAYSTFAGARLAATNTPIAIVAWSWIGFGVASMAGAALTVAIVRFAAVGQFALVAALTCGALGSLVASFDSATAALAGSALVGFGLAATPTVVSAYARDRCSAQEYPGAFSYATAALGVGQLIGPVVAGILADTFGTGAVPLFAAAAYGIGAAMAAADALVMRRAGPL